MNLLEIFKYFKFTLRRFGVFMVLNLAVFLAIGYFYITNNDRQYNATATIRVSRALESSIPTQFVDVNVLTRLNKSISKIATESTTLDLVEGTLQKEFSDSTLRRKVRVFPYPDMDLIDVTGIDTDPQYAQKVSNALAEAILTRHKQLEEETPTGTRLQIIQEARVPNVAASIPRRTLFILWSFISLIGTIAIWLTAFLVDRRIESEDDLLSLFDYPLIASIPLIRGKQKEKNILRDKYQTVASFLTYADLKSTNKAIAVVSTGKGEGKSISTANIAKSFSYLNQKVLLVDLDTRRPSLDKIFRIPNKQDSYSRAIIRSTSFPEPTKIEDNIDIYTAGTVADWECARIFASPRIKDIIKGHNKENEWVVFDTPPILSLPSVIAALKQIENVILVVRLRRTRKNELASTIKMLKTEDINIAGIVTVGSKQRTQLKYYAQDAQ